MQSQSSMLGLLQRIAREESPTESYYHSEEDIREEPEQDSLKVEIVCSMHWMESLV